MTRRIGADPSWRGIFAGIAAIAPLGLPLGVAHPAFVRAARPILFTNFRLFDRKSRALPEGLGLPSKAIGSRPVATGMRSST
jgi:hypothetical protein